MHAHAFDRQTKILMLVIATAALLTHSLALTNDFVRWDDPALIYENPLVQHFTWKIFATYDPELYIPITLLTFQIEHALFGFNPFFFHLTSVLLHTANAIFVFLLFQLLTQKRWLPFFGALLFAVHPITVEAVGWVSARKEVLATFFFLLSLITYLRSQESHQSKQQTLSIVFFALGLMSKVTVIVLPLVLLLLDYRTGNKITVRSVREKWPYFGLAAAFGVVAMFGKASSVSLLSPLEIGLLANKSLLFYIQKLLVPTGFSAIYPTPDNIAIAAPTFFAPLVIILAFLIGAWMFRRYNRDATFGAGLFFFALLPSFLAYQKANSINIASDRYAYLPLIGFLFLLLSLLWMWAQPKHLKMGMKLVTVAVAVIFVVMSHRQHRVWHNSETLFTDVLAKNPMSHIAHNNLGFYHMEEGRDDPALEFFLKAVALDPEYADAHVNLGTLYAKQGDFDRAMFHLQKALETVPVHVQAHFNVGGIYFMQGNDTAAIEEYLTTLAINPYHVPALWQLTRTYWRTNQIDLAKEIYQRLLSIDDSYRGRIPELDVMVE